MTNPPAYQRAKDRRLKDRMDLIAKQKAEGTLVVRKMTAKERRFWGPVKDPVAAAKRAKRKVARDV